jgi:hypothetical protein
MSTYSKVVNVSQDQRVAASGPVATLVSPGASVAAGGGAAITAAAGSSVSQHIESVGLQGDAVNSILAGLAQDRASERASFSNIADDLTSAFSAQGQQVTQALAATRAPESTLMQYLVPVIVAVIILAFLK